MTRLAYYSEIDRYCCARLRELIALGAIPNGVVDERDIRTVDPQTLKDYGQIHLFAGIAGGAVACRLAGVPDDFRLITAGVPCQPASVAGQQRGADDDRWLWPETVAFLRVLGEHHALLENPTGLLTLNNGVEFGAILGELAEIGRDVEWDCVPAAAVGAPHQRDRLWIIAYAGAHRTDEPAAYWPVADARRITGELRGADQQMARETRGVAGARQQRQRHRDATGHSGATVADAGGVEQPEEHPLDDGEHRERPPIGRRPVEHTGARADGANLGRDLAEGDAADRTTPSGDAGARSENVADATGEGRHVRWWPAPGEEEGGRALGDTEGCGDWESQSGLGGVADGLSDRMDAPLEPFAGWEEEPGIPRVAGKIAHRVDRLRGLGNAWVPQAAVPALLIILERGGA